MDDRHFRQLLDRFDLSWDGYRKVRKGVKKRISRHMQELGCRKIEGYLLALEQSQEAKTNFERFMTVSISRFFRDESLWQVLQQEILPTVIRRERNQVKIWSAGCACGEEVYSLKILWDVLMASAEKSRELHILATDANPDYLSKARTGIYGHSSLRETCDEWKTRYFSIRRKGKTFAITQELKGGIVWQVHDLSLDPPDSGFQMIFMRNNVLTYYKDGRKILLLRKVTDSLMPGGFLVIGDGEKMPHSVEGLVPCNDHPCLFQKTA